MLELIQETQGASEFLCLHLSEEDVLDDFKYGMIRNNTIKGILPFISVQVDGQMVFKYDVTSRINLKNIFGAEFDEKVLLTILKNLCKTFDEIQEYGLEISDLCLKEEFIYVDRSKTNVEFVYIPLEFRKADVEIKEFFRNLILDSARYSKNGSTRYIGKLMDYLNTSIVFSLEEFEKGIDELLLGNCNTYYKIKESIGEQKDSVEFPIPKRNNEKTALEEDVDSLDMMGKKRGIFSFIKKEKKEKNKENKKEETVGMKKERKKKEKYKEKNKEKTKEKINLGFWIPGEDQNPHALDELEQPKNNIVSKHDIQKIDRNDVFMDALVPVQKKREKYPCIKQLRTGKRIEIRHSNFKLGRKRGAVDFCIEKNIAVSRIHASIVKELDGYKIIDNNSRNFTYVDDRKITPGVPVLLKNGSKIRLADEEVEFWFR